MADSFGEFSQAAQLPAGASPTVVVAAVAGMGRALMRLVVALRAAGIAV